MDSWSQLPAKIIHQPGQERQGLLAVATHDSKAQGLPSETRRDGEEKAWLERGARFRRIS